MWHRKKLVPDSFDEWVVFSQVTGLPGEHAYQFRMKVIQNGEEVHWQRIWAITDLQTEFAEIEVGLDPLDSLDRARRHQLHKFRVDIVRYLRASHQHLVIREGTLVLEAQQ